MKITNYNQTVLEEVSDYCLVPHEQFFNYFMVRISYILMI